MEKIVVRLVANHPTGTRNRAGFTFTENPSVVEVNESQLEAIQNDQYLRIITKGTAFLQGMENPQSPKGSEEGDDEGGDEGVDMTKAQIIEKLIEKGLQEGVDFNKGAKKDILLQLLNA